ncbi:hypothetical protein FB564_1484 [Salinispora arenicola]|nr:hypothetical protein FB564_1484 [Salinispora arenicola]
MKDHEHITHSRETVARTRGFAALSKRVVWSSAAGFAAGGLLLGVAVYAWSADRPLTVRVGILLAVVVLLGMTSSRLIDDARIDEHYEQRASAHVEGTRETVDRLAAALQDARGAGKG